MKFKSRILMLSLVFAASLGLSSTLKLQSPGFVVYADLTESEKSFFAEIESGLKGKEAKVIDYYEKKNFQELGTALQDLVNFLDDKGFSDSKVKGLANDGKTPLTPEFYEKVSEVLESIESNVKGKFGGWVDSSKNVDDYYASEIFDRIKGDDSFWSFLNYFIASDGNKLDKTKDDLNTFNKNGELPGVGYVLVQTKNLFRIRPECIKPSIEYAKKYVQEHKSEGTNSSNSSVGDQFSAAPSSSDPSSSDLLSDKKKTKEEIIAEASKLLPKLGEAFRVWVEEKKFVQEYSETAGCSYGGICEKIWSTVDKLKENGASYEYIKAQVDPLFNGMVDSYVGAVGKSMISKKLDYGDLGAHFHLVVDSLVMLLGYLNSMDYINNANELALKISNCQKDARGLGYAAYNNGEFDKNNGNLQNSQQNSQTDSVTESELWDVIGSLRGEYRGFENDKGIYKLRAIDSFLGQFIQKFEIFKKTQKSPSANSPSSGPNFFDGLLADFKGSFHEMFEDLKNNKGMFEVDVYHNHAKEYNDYIGFIKDKLSKIYFMLCNQQIEIAERKQQQVVSQQTVKQDPFLEELKAIVESVSKMGSQIFSQSNNGQDIGLVADFVGSMNYLTSRLGSHSYTNADGTVLYFDFCLKSLLEIFATIDSGNFSFDKIKTKANELKDCFERFFRIDPNYSQNAQRYTGVINNLDPNLKIITQNQDQGMTELEMKTCQGIAQGIDAVFGGLYHSISKGAVSDLIKRLKSLVDLFGRYFAVGLINSKYKDAYGICLTHLGDLIEMAKAEKFIFSGDSSENGKLPVNMRSELRNLVVMFCKLDFDFSSKDNRWLELPYGSVYKNSKKKVKEDKPQGQSNKKIVFRRKKIVKGQLPVGSFAQELELVKNVENAISGRQLLFSGIAKFFKRFFRLVDRIRKENGVIVSIPERLKKLNEELRDLDGYNYDRGLTLIESILASFDEIGKVLLSNLEKGKNGNKKDGKIKFTSAIYDEILPLFMSAQDKVDAGNLKNKTSGVFRKVTDYIASQDQGLGWTNQMLNGVIEFMGKFEKDSNNTFEKIKGIFAKVKKNSKNKSKTKAKKKKNEKTKSKLKAN